MARAAPTAPHLCRAAVWAVHRLAQQQSHQHHAHRVGTMVLHPRMKYPHMSVPLLFVCRVGNSFWKRWWGKACCCSHQQDATITKLPATLLCACRVGDSWHVLPPLPPTSAVLLFGLCTAWRSNDRLRAAEHRVTDAAASGLEGTSPRRLSAVLFMGGCSGRLLGWWEFVRA